jgi:hypothetical protein
MAIPIPLSTQGTIAVLDAKNRGRGYNATILICERVDKGERLSNSKDVMKINNVKNVKIIVFVPETHTDVVRKAMGDAGAGIIGNYSHCTFSSKGIGRFRPESGANPSIGEVGKFEEVVEERIETVCPREKIEEVIKAIKKVHPYDEVALDVYQLENI